MGHGSPQTHREVREAGADTFHPSGLDFEFMDKSARSPEKDPFFQA